MTKMSRVLDKMSAEESLLFGTIATVYRKEEEPTEKSTHIDDIPKTTKTTTKTTTIEQTVSAIFCLVYMLLFGSYIWRIFTIYDLLLHLKLWQSHYECFASWNSLSLDSDLLRTIETVQRLLFLLCFIGRKKYFQIRNILNQVWKWCFHIVFHIKLVWLRYYFHIFH